MKPLNAQQAGRCENATTSRCRCRCNGQAHGAGRGEVIGLPADDPHAVEPGPAQLELGVQLTLFGPATPKENLAAARAALAGAVAAYEDRKRMITAQRHSRRPDGRRGPANRIDTYAV